MPEKLRPSHPEVRAAGDEAWILWTDGNLNRRIQQTSQTKAGPEATKTCSGKQKSGCVYS